MNAGTTSITTSDDDAITKLSPFATSFLALPPELLTGILLYLSPSDLALLARIVEPLGGVEKDAYLWSTWVRRTAPALIAHALFSPLSLRPDPLELVRRGTLRGVAIISGVRSQGYWASEPAVRLSKIHEKLTRRTLRRSLSSALLLRPSRRALVSRGILPSAAARGAHPTICARAQELERQRQRDIVRQMLREKGPRRFADVSDRHVWHDEERVVLALCPGIREKQRFWEGLVARATPCV